MWQGDLVGDQVLARSSQRLSAVQNGHTLCFSLPPSLSICLCFMQTHLHLQRGHAQLRTATPWCNRLLSEGACGHMVPAPLISPTQL